MTLDEIFEKYDDDKKAYRKNRSFSPKSIDWCKQLKAWGNEESRALGFFIPKFMIEDANADDWEIEQ